MDKVLCGLDEFSAAYVDDIIISSKPWKENLEVYSTIACPLTDLP